MDATVTIDDARGVHRYTLFAAESLTNNARITELYSTQVLYVVIYTTLTHSKTDRPDIDVTPLIKKHNDSSKITSILAISASLVWR